MTDKQIIIDVCPYQGECSVSGCKRNDDGCFVRQLFEERYRAENRIVELNKTLQAKEQECEAYKMESEEGKEINAELKAENDRLDNEAQNLFTEKTNLEIEIKELKAENERLKKEIRLYDCIDKWGTEQCRCACRCLGNEFCNDADKKINKLKQAIKRIKEILLFNIEELEECLYNDIDKQILKICDEVNDER